MAVSAVLLSVVGLLAAGPTPSAFAYGKTFYVAPTAMGLGNCDDAADACTMYVAADNQQDGNVIVLTVTGTYPGDNIVQSNLKIEAADGVSATLTHGLTLGQPTIFFSGSGTLVLQGVSISGNSGAAGV